MKRIFSAIFIFFVTIALSNCDQELQKIGINYKDMLEANYNQSGEGKIIQLTIEKAIDVDGVATNDGKYMFYSSDRERGNFDIYMRSLSDIMSVRITSHAAKDISPAVSPNGKYLAWVSERDDPEGDILVMSIDPKKIIDKVRSEKTQTGTFGNDSDNITRETDPITKATMVFKDADPAWSPDSKKIVFSSTRAGGMENLFLCDRKGKEKTQITFDGGMHPQFSQDGTKVIYISYKENKLGDVYIYDLPTMTSSRITNSDAIKMHPAFAGSNSAIVYTLIDKDSNHDGKVSLEDKSVLYYQNLETGMSYPLTYYSVSSFKARWYPFYLTKYEGIEEPNFNGVMIYSEQGKDKITVNMMPEYGLVPKRLDASKQYKLAEKMIQDQASYDQTSLSMYRVYNFFGLKEDEESVIYTVKALKDLALMAYDGKETGDAKKYLSNLSGIKGLDIQNYRAVTAEYLKKETSGENGEKVLIEALYSIVPEEKKTISGVVTEPKLAKKKFKLGEAIIKKKDGPFGIPKPVDKAPKVTASPELKKEPSASEPKDLVVLPTEVNKKIVPYLLEDIGDHYQRKGNFVKMAEFYEKIVKEYPSYDRVQKVKLSLGDYYYNKISSNIPEQYLNLLATGSEYQKDQIAKKLYKIFKSEALPKQRIMNIEKQIATIKSIKETETVSSVSKNEALKILNLILADTYYEMSDLASAEKTLSSVISTFDTGLLIGYKANKLYADIYLKKNDKANEEIYLYNSAVIYQKKWMQPDIKDAVSRLVTIYENTGEDYESSGNYGKAVNVYKKYREFISIINKNGSAPDLYSEFGPRAHVYYIDAFYNKNKNSYDSLENLEEEYNKKLKAAKDEYDTGYVYGLAYVYAKMAYHLDQHYLKKGNFLNVRKGTDFGKENITLQSVPLNFKNSVDNLEWTLFVNEDISDSYILRGWIYNYLDGRKQEDLKSDGDLAEEIDRLFPKYMLEDNIKNYERALSAVNEMKSPEEAGNLHLNLANTYYDLKNFDKALGHYIAAKQYKKRFNSTQQETLFYYHLAYCYYQTDQNEKAIKELDKIVQNLDSQVNEKNAKVFAKKYITVYRMYALFNRVAQKYGEAISWYNKILNIASKNKIDVNYARYYQEIAACYFYMGDYDNSLSYIAKSDKELKKIDYDDQKKYNLKLTMFGFIGPFGVYDVGQDYAAFGDARIFEPLESNMMRVLNLSIKEEIYYRQGNYYKVIDVLNKKIKIAEEKDTQLYSEVKMKSLNNLGQMYYLIGDYIKSDKNIQAAWDFSASKENQDGIFQCILNKTKLYAFLMENNQKFFKNPLKSLDTLTEKVNTYKNNYEADTYKIKLAALEDKAKIMKTEVTPEEKIALKESIKEEAKVIYFKLDVAISTLNFYRAELLAQDLDLKNSKFTEGYELFAYNRNIYNLYSTSATVFESAMESTIPEITNREKILLMVNSAVCRERLGQINEGYKLLGQAEKMVQQYAYYDIEPVIYLYEAKFITNNMVKLKTSPSQAESYYEKSIRIIEDAPQVYSSRMNKVNEIYDNYSVVLAENGKNKKSFEVRERGRKIKRILSIFQMAPSFSDENDMAAFEKIRNTVNILSQEEQAYSAMLEKGLDTKSPQLKNSLTRIAQLKKEIKSIKTENDLFNSYVALTDTLIEKSKDIIFDFSFKDGVLNSWVLHKGEVSFYKNKVEDSLDASLNYVFNKQSGKEGKKYIIINDSVFKATESLPFQAVFIYSINDIQYVSQGNDIFYKNGIVLKDSVSDYMAKGKTSLLEYSVITDNNSNSYDLAQLLFEGKMKPTLLVKRTDEKIDDMQLLYCSALYDNAALILFYSDKNVPVTGDKPSLSFEKYEEMNSLKVPVNQYVSIGVSGQINKSFSADSSAESVLLSLFKEKIEEGSSQEALYYLYRWKELAIENDDNSALYMMNQANVKLLEGSYVEAMNMLNSVKESKITSVEIRDTVRTNKIYVNLLNGNQNDAEIFFSQILEGDDLKNFEDYKVYQKILQGIKSGVIDQEMKVSGKSIINAQLLSLLYAKYIAILQTRSNARHYLETNVKDFNGSDIDKLSIEMITYGGNNFKWKTVRAGNISEIYNRDNTNVTEFFSKNVLNKGVYDEFSLFAVDSAIYGLKKQFRSKDVNLNIKTIDTVALSQAGSLLNRIILFEEIRKYYHVMNMKEEELAIINQLIEICSLSNFSAALEKYKVYKAELYCSTGQYSLAEETVKSIKDKDLNPGNVIYPEYLLVSAEIDVFNNKAKKTPEILSGYQFKEDDEKIMLNLVNALSQMKKIELDPVYDSTGYPEIKSSLKKVLSAIEEKPAVIDGYFRPDILEKILAYAVNHEFDSNKEESLLFSEVKKQLLLKEKYGNKFEKSLMKTKTKVEKSAKNDKNNKKKKEKTEISSVEEKKEIIFKKFMSDVPVEKIKEKIGKDSLLVILTVAGEDVLTWFIDNNGMQGIRIPGCMGSISLSLSKYEEKSLSQQNTLDVSDELSTSLSLLLEKIKDKNTLYLMHDSDLEKFPFEILSIDDKYIIETKDIFYISSLSSVILEKEISDFSKTPVGIYNVNMNNTDKVEQIAIKQTGIDFIRVDKFDSLSGSNVAHVQMPIYYDEMNKQLMLSDQKYGKYLADKDILFISNDQLSVNDINSYIMINNEIGNKNIIINGNYIRDVNSALITGEFYKQIKEGNDCRKAFMKSKRVLLGDSRYIYPCYWAGLRLYVNDL